jgi:hypothetical protein
MRRNQASKLAGLRIGEILIVIVLLPRLEGDRPEEAALTTETGPVVELARARTERAQAEVPRQRHVVDPDEVRA